MSNIRFNDKTQISSIAGTEFIPITDGIDDLKASPAQIADYINNYLTIPALKTTVSTNTINISTLTLTVNSLDAQVSTNSINISNLETEVDIAIISYTKNAINSGQTDSSGNANILSYSSNNVIFDTDPAIELTDYAGNHYTVSSISNLAIPVSPVSQTWNIYLGSDGTVEAFSTPSTVGKVLTASPVANEVYYLTSVEPAVQYKRNSGNTAWETYNKVWIGQAITNDSGVITSVVQPKINQNGYNVNRNTVSKYDSGWFAVAVNTTYTKTHNLNTNNITFKVLGATNSSGSNSHEIHGFNMDNAGNRFGYNIDSVTSSIITLTTAVTSVDINKISATHYRLLAEVIQ